MPTPRETTFDVRIWKTQVRKGNGGTSKYRVRWSVAGRSRSRTFVTAAAADSERSELMTALRRGEAFDVESGLPVSRNKAEKVSMSWWEWAMTFVDVKWDDLAPTSRRSTADELVVITSALTPRGKGAPPASALRSAMFRWAFNSAARKTGPPPADLSVAIDWLNRNSVRLDDLEDSVFIRSTLEAMTRRIDGRPAARTTIARRRAVFHNALGMAVERDLLAANPLDRVRWKLPRETEAIDPRSVANPQQAKALLAAIKAGRPTPAGIKSPRRTSDERFVAFFACMYYSALRPSEVTVLSISDLEIPEKGWGWLLISKSNADVSGSWTDGGKRTARQLKHRPRGDVRKVPCPPQLSELLHRHIELFGTTPGGRLFRGLYGGDISSKSYTGIWASARERAFTRDQAASRLVRRPYDLRHSAVSTWLAAGVDSAQVAAWAGHSIAVLHRVYAHVITGRETVAQDRIQSLLDAEPL